MKTRRKKQPGFSCPDASKRMDVPVRTIQHYTSRELVEPMQPSGGRGNPTRYSKENLVELYVIRQLANYLLLTKVAKIMDTVRKHEEWRAWMSPDDPGGLENAKLIIFNPKSTKYWVKLKDGQRIEIDFQESSSAIIVDIGKGILRAHGA